MDDIQLTQLFVEYALHQAKMIELKAEIEKEVLARGKSVAIAGVEAKYYKPSEGTPDYEGAVKEWWDRHPEDTHAYMSDCSTTTVSVSWKKVCDYLLLAPPSGELKPARVVVK